MSKSEESRRRAKVRRQTKVKRLVAQFKKARKSGDTAFNSMLQDVVEECFQAVAARYGKVTRYKIVLCNARTFADLLSHQPVMGTIPTAFINKLEGIITINLDAFLGDTWGTLVVNLVMNLMEEILHATFPFANEPRIKKMTYELSEEYLEMKIPSSYKEETLKRTAGPDY
jgi:hypothetical protein